MQMDVTNLKDLVDNVADTAVVVLTYKLSDGEYAVAQTTKGDITEVCTLIASLITTQAEEYIRNMKYQRPDELARTESAIMMLITKSLKLNRVDGISEVEL